MLKLRIKELLDERGMSTMDLSKQAGLTYNTALGLVRGTSDRILFETLEKLCRALDVPPGELFVYEPGVNATAITKRPRRTKRAG